MDWSKLISSIQKRGLSQTQIAEICGCGQVTISDLLKGTPTEPRFTLGQKLIVLSKAGDRELKRLCSKQKAEA